MSLLKDLLEAGPFKVTSIPKAGRVARKAANQIHEKNLARMDQMKREVQYLKTAAKQEPDKATAKALKALAKDLNSAIEHLGRIASEANRIYEEH